MRFRRPRGTQDLLPAEAARWGRAADTMRARLAAFGYGEIRTPLFEETELFVRGVGTGTDIVEKEMYTFQDRKGRSLTLRPEGTAPVVRAFLENQMGGDGGVRRLYYLGPMYRYDRPQAGRFREFFQVGAEAIGASLPEIDVEIIDLMMTMLQDVGLRNLSVEINSVGHPACRSEYEIVLRAALTREAGSLCATCVERSRSNPLRVLDCKVASCQPVLRRLPTLRDHLCADCRGHHAAVLSGLESLGLRYHEDPFLVRGLDYYTRTAFEVHDARLGAQSAIGGGGRYDGLFEACGGPPTPAVGFSAGIERILGILAEHDPTALGATVGPAVVVLPLGAAARRRALAVARDVRRAASVEVDYSGRSLKAQLRAADKSGARVAVLLGDDELARGAVQLRDLASGHQEPVPWDELAARVRAVLATPAGAARTGGGPA